MRGEIVLDGRGHLQEHLAGSIGLAAGLFDEGGCQVSTGEEPMPVPDWSAAADVGFAALGVATEVSEHDLTACGAHFSDATRHSSGIRPRLAWRTPLSGRGALEGSALDGAVVIDAAAQLSDALDDAQSIGSTTARARAAAALRLTFDGAARSLTLHLADPGEPLSEPATDRDGLTDEVAVAPAGVVRIDGAVRHALRWCTKTTTLTATWTDALDAISDGDWLGGVETRRDPVEGHNTIEVAWVCGGYRLCESVGEE